MNRPKITKQTLKELRGELWSRQSSQKQTANNNENDDTVNPAVTQTDVLDVDVAQEEENELSM